MQCQLHGDTPLRHFPWHILQFRWHKPIHLTSLFAPQFRSGKTVITQREAEASDLNKGQPIAAIYAGADKEVVLLNAVLKLIEKPVEKK